MSCSLSLTLTKCIFRHSDIEPKSIEPFTMYSTLPRSLRETKLVTNVKVEEDEDTLLARRAMVESKSPAELSAINSISDLPIPSRVSKIVARNQAAPSCESKLEIVSNNKSTRLVCSFHSGKYSFQKIFSAK